MSFEPVTPQYKRLKSGEFTSLTLRITDQKDNSVTDGPLMTIVPHIRNIGRVIVKKLAVRFKENEILGVDDLDMFACHQDL